MLLCDSEVNKKNKILSHNTPQKDGILLILQLCSVVCGVLIRHCVEGCSQYLDFPVDEIMLPGLGTRMKTLLLS